MTNMTFMQICAKKLKTLFQNPLADYLASWYEASGDIFFKFYITNDLGLTTIYFMVGYGSLGC